MGVLHWAFVEAGDIVDRACYNGVYKRGEAIHKGDLGRLPLWVLRVTGSLKVVVMGSENTMQL